MVLMGAGVLFGAGVAEAQQLPDPHFEDWSVEFNKDKQLKDWHGKGRSYWLLRIRSGQGSRCIRHYGDGSRLLQFGNSVAIYERIDYQVCDGGYLWRH